MKANRGTKRNPQKQLNGMQIIHCYQHTTAGGAAAEAITITGVSANDLAFVTIVDDGTGSVTLVQAVCTANTVTVTFSANPQTDTVVNILVMRNS